MRSVEDILADAERWSVRDVAGFLRVGASWVYRQVELGNLPATRQGAAIRFDPATVRAFAKAIARGELAETKHTS